MKKLAFTFCILNLAFGILGAQTKTRVQDTLFLADGSKASGSLNIAWPAFVTTDGFTVARSSLSVKIVNGNVTVDLVPTVGTIPAGISYTVTFSLSNSPSYTEFWLVPLTGPVTIAQVRISPMPIPTTTFGEQQLTLGTGLQTLLGLWKRNSNPVPTAEGQCYWDGLAHAIMCTDASLEFQPLAGGGGSTPDATVGIKGKLKLAGDLNGTADLPTVPNMVRLGGDQTVAGIKTFSDSLAAGSLAAGAKLSVQDSGTKTATTYGAYVANNALSSSAVDKYGLHVSSTGAWSGSGANNYGLHVAPVSGAANNWDAWIGSPASAYSGVIQEYDYPHLGNSVVSRANSASGYSFAVLAQNNSTTKPAAGLVTVAEATNATPSTVPGSGLVPLEVGAYFSGSGSIPNVDMISAYAEHRGTGEAYNFRGLSTYAAFGNYGLHPNSGGVTFYTGLGTGFDFSTNNTIIQARGLNVSGPSNSGGSGTISNLYGIRIEDHGVPFATNKYALKIEDQTGAEVWALKTGTGKVEVGALSGTGPRYVTTDASGVLTPGPSAAVRFPEQFPGVDACAQIAAAIADLPVGGGTVDGRGLQGAQVCASNPFSGVLRPVKLLLGTTVMRIDVPWVITASGSPTVSSTQIIGLGSGGTTIQTSANFPVSAPFAISSCTNAVPIVCTTTAPHGFAQYDFVHISGVTGNTSANGTWRLDTAPGATTLTLTAARGNAAYISGGTAIKVTPLVRFIRDDAPIFDAGVRDLVLDCNFVAGCAGFIGQSLQNQSLIENVWVNSPTVGIALDNGTTQPSAGVRISRVQVVATAVGAVGLMLRSLGTDVTDIVCDATTTVQGNICVRVNSNVAVLTNILSEKFTDVIWQDPITILTVQQASGLNHDPPGGATSTVLHTFSGDYTARALVAAAQGGSAVPNGLRDEVRNSTLAGTVTAIQAGSGMTGVMFPFRFGATQKAGIVAGADPANSLSLQSFRPTGIAGAQFWQFGLGSAQADGNPTSELISCNTDLTNCHTYWTTAQVPGGAQAGFRMALDPSGTEGTFVGGAAKIIGATTLTALAGTGSRLVQTDANGLLSPGPASAAVELIANKNQVSGYAGLDAGGKVSAGQLPSPGTSTLGGVKSLTCSGSDKLSAIGTDGMPVCSADQGGGGAAWGGITGTLSSQTDLQSALDARFVRATSNTLTNASAPSTPAAGFTSVWTDTTDKTLKAKDDAGVVTTTVKPQTCTGTDKLSAIGANGVPVCSADQSGGGGTWGSITGTLSTQTDLQSALDSKAALVTSGTAGVGPAYVGDASTAARSNHDHRAFGSVTWYFPGTPTNGVQNLTLVLPDGIVNPVITDIRATVNTTSASSSTVNIQRCTASCTGTSPTFANIYASNLTLSANTRTAAKGSAPDQNVSGLAGGDQFKANLVTIGASLADITITMTYKVNTTN